MFSRCFMLTPMNPADLQAHNASGPRFTVGLKIGSQVPTSDTVVRGLTPPTPLGTNMAAASPAAPMADPDAAAAIAAEPPAARTPRKKTPPPPITAPFDFSQPPVIEGFEPSAMIMREETFKEKFLRKTKENPFVPIGELYNDVQRGSFWLHFGHIRF